MVYESDFYTTRRPYSRPPVSTYSVTLDPLIPVSGLGQGPYHSHHIPFIGHKRLTIVSAPPHTNRVRPSVLMGELDRISHRSRPHVSFRPTEDYLNSRSAVSFDDETRSIRAQTQALLRRINSPVPRTPRPLPISTTRYEFEYEEPIVTSRITSDAYIQRLLGPVRRVQHDVNNMAHYPEPGNNRRHIGKGHLACISFAGGRAFSRRKGLATSDDRIQDDVTYLSMYKKNRNAANGVKEEGQGTEVQAQKPEQV